MKNSEFGLFPKDIVDDYFAELDAAEEADREAAFMFGGGYEASKGDYEGACLARGEYEAGKIS